MRDKSLALCLLAFVAGGWIRRGGFTLAVLWQTILLGAGLGTSAILLYLFFYLSFSSQAGGLLPYVFPPTRLPQYLIQFAPFIFILAFLLILTVRSTTARGFPWQVLLRACLDAGARPAEPTLEDAYLFGVRLRIVVRERPVYYETEPRYAALPPRYDEREADYPGYNADNALSGCNDPTTGQKVNKQTKFLPYLARSNWRACNFANTYGFKCADSFAQYMGADYDANGDGQIDSDALAYVQGESEAAYVTRITATLRSTIRDANTHFVSASTSYDYIQSDDTHPTYTGGTVINGATMLDASVYGIGRGPGNCCLELLFTFLQNPKFRLKPVLELIQNYYLPLREKIEWGYNEIYGISGLLNQHPREAMKWRADKAKMDDCFDFYEYCTRQDLGPIE